MIKGAFLTMKHEETFIPMDDVLISIKYHPDITEKDKQEFKHHVGRILRNGKTEPKQLPKQEKVRDRVS